MGIVSTVGPATAAGLLVVYGDTLQEDGFPVEQYLLVTGLDGAEPYLIGIGGRVERQLHLVELGVLRRPQLQLLGTYLERGLGRSLAVSGELLYEFQLRNADGDLVSGLFLVQSDREINLPHLGFVFAFLQLQTVVLHIHGSHLDQLHVACDSPVVPPVEDLCGHVLGMAFVVDLNYHHVLALA